MGIMQVKYQPDVSEGFCLIRIAPRSKELRGKPRTAWTFCCLDYGVSQEDIFYFRQKDQITCQRGLG